MAVEHYMALRAIPGQLSSVPPMPTRPLWPGAPHGAKGPVHAPDAPERPRPRPQGHKGRSARAYVLAEAEGGEPDAILIGTGSEVSVALEARNLLAGQGVSARVVSMPVGDLREAG